MAADGSSRRIVAAVVLAAFSDFCGGVDGVGRGLMVW
jgi:hypothetical protein